MNGIVKVDWDAFNYIHAGKARDAFQALAEQLFCFEYNQPYGIYRFFNQPYIETEPINIGTESVGFQSKYFDAATALSSRKQELIDTIEGAHSTYPALTKLVLYINKEPGAGKSKQERSPGYILEIEAHAAAVGIRIEWIGLNQIETMLHRPELEYIREYFFDTNGGIRQTLKQIQSHTNSLFDSIDVDMQYRQTTIRIEKEPIPIDDFLGSDKSVLIVHGEGGCGKSALVKQRLGAERHFPVWFFRATDMDTPTVPEFVRRFGNNTWEETLSIFDDSPRKICVIDSAEKALTIQNQTTFETILKSFQAHGWRVIVTIRTGYKESFLTSVLKSSEVYEHGVANLSLRTLLDVETKYQLPLPTEGKTRGLLCNLFNLKLFLAQNQTITVNSPIDFENFLWNQVICDTSKQKDSLCVRRGEMAKKLAENYASSGYAYYQPNVGDDWDAITSLRENGIIQHDEILGGYFFCHDGYEEIALRKIISTAFQRKESTEAFFQEVGDSMVIRKAFRMWLIAHLQTVPEEVEQFLSDVLSGAKYPLIWKDEILIALFGENTDLCASLCSKLFAEDNNGLLFRALHLLNTACRKVDDELYRRFLTEDEIKTAGFNLYRYTKPAGTGWEFLITYTYENRERISWTLDHITLVTEVIWSWAKSNKEGKTTRFAGLLALFLYNKTNSGAYLFRTNRDLISRIDDTIMHSAKEIQPELTSIFEDVLNGKKIKNTDMYTELCEHMLKNAFSTGVICECLPDTVIKLAKLFWLNDGQETDDWNHLDSVGVSFGLRSHIEHEYYPSSAFQTPILPLLNSNPDKTSNFIIELINVTTQFYYTSDLNRDGQECSTLELTLPNGTQVQQLVSDRLWNMYRGTSVAPNLLESILMTFERWLYQLIRTSSSKEYTNALCILLLSKTTSAAITAVIVGLVNAFPDKLFQVACILVQAPEIFLLDTSRLALENSSGFLSGMNPNNKIYDQEREKSNALPFRKKLLRETIVDYQIKQSDLSDADFQERQSALFQAIDLGFSPEKNLSESELFVLYRMDIRKMKLVKAKTADGESGIALISDLPKTLEQVQNNQSEENKKNDKYLQLFVWSRARFTHDSDTYSQYAQYESNPNSALNDALELVSNPSFLQVGNGWLLYVAATLLKDFTECLSEDQIDICGKFIIEHVQTVISQQSVRPYGDGTDAAIKTLPMLFGRIVASNMMEDPAVLLLMLICDWGKQRDLALQALRDQVWETDPNLARGIVSLFVMLKPGYDKEVSRFQGISPEEYFIKHEKEIQGTLKQAPLCIPDFSELSINAQMALCLSLPCSSCTGDLHVWLGSGENIWPVIFADRLHGTESKEFKDYALEFAYLDHFACCLIHSSHDVQQATTEKLFLFLPVSDHTDRLLTSLIFAQDYLKKPESFWNLWNLLFSKISDLCNSEKDKVVDSCENKKEMNYFTGLDKILTSYLLAPLSWPESVQEWHTLTSEYAFPFFRNAADSLGYHPCTLYSIARVLNTAGYNFVKEGIVWLAIIIQNNPHLRSCSLPVNTEYYLEKYMQRLVQSQLAEIRRDRALRKNVIDVLNYMVERGSTCAFLLRESIG